MNRKYLPKRKCKTSPGALNPPSIPRSQECKENAIAARVAEEEDSSRRTSIKTRVIVSISGDIEFDRRLRMAAIQNGQIVIRVDAMDAALRIVQANCCGVILLDLDSLGRTAWDMAGDLLRAPLCPPVVLLTGKGDQFDLRMTVFAGSILEKSAEAGRLLRALNAILEGLHTPGKTTPHRGIVRWEDSGNGPVPCIPVRRFWGINE